LVAISFDSTHWSKEHFPFTYRKGFEAGRFGAIAGTYLAVVVLVGLFIWRVAKGKRRVEEEERVPFIGQAIAREGPQRRKGTRKRGMDV
jgi:hypothetical protein